ncbi:MAG: type VI secretion system baseplate subunit TssG, partial [Sulfuricurvum sp.]|nr:type VI secretion system baseplate subunit TssG [Sulfuricurvum sp.]
MKTEEINNTLNEIVARATLPQAIRISMQYLREYYPQMKTDDLYKKIYFRANPSLSFQKSDLSTAVLKRNDEGMFIELTLNFLAVFGSSSPLPSHYCEMVLQSVDSDNVLRDYLDIFNHHLQNLVYPIWMKYRYYIHYQYDMKDQFSKYMLSLLGLYHEHQSQTSRLNLQKLMPYLGILSMRQKSAGMLIPILR